MWRWFQEVVHCPKRKADGACKVPHVAMLLQLNGFDLCLQSDMVMLELASSLVSMLQLKQNVMMVPDDNFIVGLSRMVT
jgi:hypothetical protein